MNPDQLWEDRDSILTLAIICADSRVGAHIEHANTADEAHEIAWSMLTGVVKNAPAKDFWKKHQSDCKALACYHLQIIAEIIGWPPEQTTPEPTLES